MEARRDLSCDYHGFVAGMGCRGDENGMRVEMIKHHEASFRKNPVDAHGKKHTMLKKAIEIPGEEGEMRYVDIKPPDETYFYRVKYPKQQIVLHFTMGYLKGDIATLTKPNYHVSVPFELARDGLIYNLFPSFYWSYHLGRGTLGGNRYRSRASIGIELSNIGQLTRDGEQMLTYYSKPSRKDIYCKMDQKKEYMKTSFKGWDYFATFTDAQYKSLIVLLRYLTARYSIPRKFLPVSKRYKATKETAHFKGIVSHVNFRPTGKTDIGPAFDWDRLEKGVRA